MIDIAQDEYVLMIHFQNPYIYMDGSENFISRQVKNLEEINIDSLIIFPIVKKKVAITISAWGMVYKEKFIKAVSISDLGEEINLINEKRKCRGVFIHSLLKMNIADIKQIGCFFNRVVLYLHDYCSCCVQYNLRKNGESFCGDAILSDTKCGDCMYYEESRKRKKEIQEYLESINDLIVIAPSEYTKGLWERAYPKLAHKVQVIGHCLLKGNYVENKKLLDENEKIKIAFVGKGLTSKGWDKWINAVERLQSNPNYVFYHFGNTPEERNYINHVDVSIKTDGPNAMIDALRIYQIHAVILFSCCPETYSYTYIESMAANQFVITSVDSGNIQDQVSVRKNGVILENSSEALYSYLYEHQDVKCAINSYRENIQIAPLELINNKEYLQFLDYDSKVRKIKCKKSFVANVNAFLTNILYRIKYSGY